MVSTSSGARGRPQGVTDDGTVTCPSQPRWRVDGGETSAGLLVELPASGVLVAGDVMMPYLGAHFLPEGSVEGLLETLQTIQRLNPHRGPRPHRAEREHPGRGDAGAGSRPSRAAPRGPQRGIRDDDTLAGISQRNGLPDVLRSQPDAVLPYLLVRNNLISRVYHQRSGRVKSKPSSLRATQGGSDSPGSVRF